jgi:hypothetical protein
MAILVVWALNPVLTQAGFLDYFNFNNWWGDGSEKEQPAASPTPTDSDEDGAVVLDSEGNPAIALDPAANHAAAACRREELETRFTGLNNLISFFSDAACSLEGVQGGVSLSGAQDVSVTTCEYLMAARKNCSNMPNPLDQPGLDEVLATMEKSEELKEAEIESKVETLEDDLRGLRNLSLIQHNLATNHQVLTGISRKLMEAYTASGGRGSHFEDELEKYGMKEAFNNPDIANKQEIFSLASIAANAFQCTPSRMAKKQNSSGAFESSEFDQESS